MNKFEKINNDIDKKPSELLMFYIMVIIEMLAMLVIALLQIVMKFKTDSIIPMLVSVAYLIAILFFVNAHPNKLPLFKKITLMPMLLVIVPYLYMGTEGGGI